MNNRTAIYDMTSGGNQIQSSSLAQSSNIPNNQIASVTQSGTYTYDANGNLTLPFLTAFDYCTYMVL